MQSSSAFNFILSVLDDKFAAVHGGDDFGDTLLFYNGLVGVGGTFVGELVDVANLDLMTDQTYNFWVRYEESTGTISIGDANDRTTPLGTGSYIPVSGTPVKVRHVFVSNAAVSGVATFKICLPASKYNSITL